MKAHPSEFALVLMFCMMQGVQAENRIERQPTLYEYVSAIVSSPNPPRTMRKLKSRMKILQRSEVNTHPECQYSRLLGSYFRDFGVWPIECKNTIRARLGESATVNFSNPGPETVVKPRVSEKQIKGNADPLPQEPDPREKVRSVETRGENASN